MNLDYPAWHKQHSNPVGKPAKENIPPPSAKICLVCYSEFGPGKPHNCSKTTRQDNLVRMVRSNSVGTRHAVTGSSLKSLARESGVSLSGGTLPLNTKGPEKMPVRLGKGRGDDRDAAVITNEQMMELQQQTGISDSKLLKIRRALGVMLGNRKLEPYLKAALTARNCDLEDFFSLKTMKFHSKVQGKEEEVERPVIFADLPALVSFLLDQRNAAVCGQLHADLQHQVVRLPAKQL